MGNSWTTELGIPTLLYSLSIEFNQPTQAKEMPETDRTETRHFFTRNASTDAFGQRSGSVRALRSRFMTFPYYSI